MRDLILFQDSMIWCIPENLAYMPSQNIQENNVLLRLDIYGV